MPDRRTASEAEIVARIGAWAGREALGRAVGLRVGCGDHGGDVALGRPDRAGRAPRTARRGADGAVPGRADTIRRPREGDGQGWRCPGSRERAGWRAIAWDGRLGKDGVRAGAGVPASGVLRSRGVLAGPRAGRRVSGALANLAAALEIQLGDYGFAMADKITTIAALDAFLPRLTRVLEDSGILLVLDNLESLLTPAGEWRDGRWGSRCATSTRPSWRRTGT